MTDTPEQTPVHRLSSRVYNGWDEWSITRILWLVIPPILTYFLGLQFSGGLVFVLPGLLIGLLLVILPPYHGLSPFEAIPSGLSSLNWKYHRKGVVIPEADHETPADNSGALGQTKQFTVIVENDDQNGGWLFSTLSSALTRMDTIYFQLKREAGITFLDAAERFKHDARFRRELKHLIGADLKHGCQMAIQDPRNNEASLSHYKEGQRFFYGAEPENVDLETATELQRTLINHGLSVADTVTQTQPQSTEYLALQVPYKVLWNGKRPDRLTATEWSRSMLPRLIEQAQTAARIGLTTARHLSTLELFEFLQASLDPYNAPEAYRIRFQDEASGISALDSLTYLDGPWPAPVITDSKHIRVGESYHAFVCIQSFFGRTMVPGAFDTMYSRWERDAFISHWTDWRFQSNKPQEYALQALYDIKSQRRDKSAIFNPKADDSVEETRDAYSRVARSGISARASMYVRITAGTAEYCDWLVQRILSELEEHDMSGYHVKGASRQVALIQRSIGCGVR